MSRGSSKVLSVAEAKRRFSELIDRVQGGERILVARRGKPVMTLGPVDDAALERRPEPAGLAATAGALADWKDLEEVVEEIYAARRRSRDRRVPDLEP